MEIPIGSKLNKQRTRKRKYFSHPKKYELFNKVVSLRREVVEKSTTRKKKINKLVSLNE
jgi:hypothetical protein